MYYHYLCSCCCCIFVTGESLWLHMDLISNMQSFCKTLFPVVAYAFTLDTCFSIRPARVYSLQLKSGKFWMVNSINFFFILKANKPSIPVSAGAVVWYNLTYWHGTGNDFFDWWRLEGKKTHQNFSRFSTLWNNIYIYIFFFFLGGEGSSKISCTPEKTAFRAPGIGSSDYKVSYFQRIP